MTNEEKQLLLKDLCARLPYELIVSYTEFEYGIKSKHTFSNLEVWNNEVRDGTALVVCDKGHSKYYIEEIKPYLRPFSSMTDKEKDELYTAMDWYGETDEAGNVYTKGQEKVYRETFYEYTDWLNAHHFDYRGLIEKGLALEAPEGMYNTE